MKRTNFTCFHQKAKLLVLVLAVLCCYSTAYSQYCSMTCNQGLQVSLNGDCEALVTYDMMLEDPHNPQTCLPNGAQAFQVQLIDAAGNVMPSSPYVNSNHIGQTVVVKVKHWATGNICWGSITVEDKLPPHIFCEDEYVWCNEDDISPGNIGFPFYYDNCDNNLDYEFWDTWHDLVCDEEYRGYVTRRWRVCDDSDNCSECEQTIFYRTAGIPDVHFPRNYDEWDLPALDCANPCTTPDCTGVPYKDGSPIDSDHSKCRIDVDYEDQILEICHASYTILRHWTVVDQCTHEIVTHTQTIKVLDKPPPTVTCPPIYAETSPWYCYGDVHVPPATIVDDCDDTWITVTTKVYGYGSGPYTGGPLEVLATLDGNGGYVTLDKGDYVVKYFVSDGCHNHSEPCVTDLHVEDKTPPTAVCDVQTTVTLQPADCEAKIFARTFDDGSHDNCCSNEELTFKVKRMGQSDAAFDDYVSFDVDDLTCNGADPVMVVMRVFDCWDPSLYSECMVEVFVEDKTPPIVTCPPNQTIYCDEDPWGLLGPVTVFDACGYTLDSVDTENIDNCGEGFVQRRYTATDLCGNVRSCTHRITIEHKNDWSVRFPKDVIVIDGDCTFNDDDNGPEIIGDDCELISIDYEDEIFTVVPDACYKIVRKWKIANWCIHNPDNADPSGDIVSTNCNWRPLMCGTPNDYRPGTYRWLDDGGDGYVEYLQVIKVLDNVEPVVECSAECEPNVEGNGCFTTHISSSATDNCTPEDELTYTWKIYDADHNLVESGNGSSTTFVSPVKGDYDVHFEVEDRCGNIGECVYNFRHEDCKKPTPYCLNGISIDLMPTTSMVTVWATDFNQGSFDNCSDQEDLVYRINSPSGGPGQTNPPNATSVTFDCGDIGTQTVDMWVGDECGNWDYCTTYVIVQDNMGACPCDDPPCGAVTASISGEVMTEMHENVEAVNISIEGTSNAFPQVTGNDGSYAFPNLSMGQNYTVD